MANVKYSYCMVRGDEIVEILTEYYWKNYRNNAKYRGCQTIKLSRENDNLYLPENYKIIGKYVVDRINVNEFHIPEGVERIEKGAFYRIEIKKLFLPKSIKVIKENVFTHVSSIEYAGDLNDYLSIDIESKGNNAFINTMNTFFGIKDFPKKKVQVKEKPVRKKTKAQIAREEEQRKKGAFENLKKELPLPKETIPQFDRWKHIAICASSSFNFYDTRYREVIDERYLSKEDLLSLGKVKNPIFLNYCVGAWCKKRDDQACSKYSKQSDAISVCMVQAFPTTCEDIFKVKDGCKYIKVGTDGLIHAYFDKRGVCEIAWDDCKMERFTSRCKYADIPFRLHLSKDDDVEQYGIEPAFIEDYDDYISNTKITCDFMASVWGKYKTRKSDTYFNFSFKVGEKQYYLIMPFVQYHSGRTMVVDYNIGKDKNGYYFDVILRLVVGENLEQYCY